MNGPASGRDHEAPTAHQRLDALVRERAAIICCGAGGVGKTTVSAALALAGARAGRRVLVVTIDPSRRLAETLGVDRNPPEPMPVPAAMLEQAGVTPPGALDAWMLDPQKVTETVIRAEAKTPGEVSELLHNRIYRHVSTMIAGLQEYAAVEALYLFLTQGRYDLVVLDTPPSRNALQFLEAPTRANLFLDGRVFQLFIPGEGGLIRRATAKLVGKVLDTTIGQTQRVELQAFFKQFSSILASTRRHALEIRDFFAQPEVSFLMVTSPAKEALAEAFHFQDKTQEQLGLQVEGYILNRSLAAAGMRQPPDLAFSGQQISETQRRALEKLRPLAELEQAQARKDHDLLLELAQRAGPDGLALALPYLGDGVTDLTTLLSLLDDGANPDPTTP